MRFPERKERQASNAGKYLKLKSKESIKGVFKGELYSFFMKWDNGKSTLVEEFALGAKRRHKINFVIYNANKQWEAKIFEFSDPVCEQLEKLNRTWPLETSVIEIVREGEGPDTRYFFTPISNLVKERKSQVLEQLQGVELNILGERKSVAEASPPPGYDDFPPPSEENIPGDESLPF